MSNLLSETYKSWKIQYHPKLSIEWLHWFLDNCNNPSEFVPLTQQSDCINYLIDSETGPLVAMIYRRQLLSMQKPIGTEAETLWQKSQLLKASGIAIAEPMAVITRKSTSIKNYETWFIRDYVEGRSLFAIFHDQSSITPELTSLAALSCQLIAQLIDKRIRLETFKATDIIKSVNGFRLVGWRGIRRCSDYTDEMISNDMAHFMKAWIERYDYHQLFVESFSRVGIKLSKLDH